MGLHNAVQERNVEQVRNILHSGTNPEIKRLQDSWTALHLAAYLGHYECAKELLHYGAYIDPLERHGSTPLHWAVAQGNLDCVQLLLDSGADLHATHMGGGSPLSVAVQNPRIAIVKYLLERGARIDHLDLQKKTPADLACTSEIRSLVQSFHNLKVVKGEWMDELSLWHWLPYHPFSTVFNFCGIDMEDLN
mmetsp:Transcript_35909/g.49187  ORF Transcript_35909/g.49187 Transcript_35909/m.49187 type:complete len:192 (-) Transcript_35909:20-595(-)